MVNKNKKLLAYIIGLAIGDGGLSNPNGRAVRLRITCDLKYPKLMEKMVKALQEFFLLNKVSIVKRKNCADLSVYSNSLEKLLGWKAGAGSKYKQDITVPDWIFKNKIYIAACLKGLIETDGSIYSDRGYYSVTFTTIIPRLAESVQRMFAELGHKANLYFIKSKKINRKDLYHVRLSKNVLSFLNMMQLEKS